MDINAQTFKESYTDYYNQKMLANKNADENDWRSMSDKQWDKMLDGIDDYVDDFKENLKKLKEVQDKAADRAAAGADSDMRANAVSSAALKAAAYGFVPQTAAGDSIFDKYNYNLTDGIMPSDPEETKAVNMSKAQELLLTGDTSAGITGTENTKESASTSDDVKEVWYITAYTDQGIYCASFDRDGNKTELWNIQYNKNDYKRVSDFLDRFPKDADLKFVIDKQFWIDFLAGNIDEDKLVKEYNGD